jgi:hypothetical protein
MNETSFRITSIKRNFLKKKTTLAKNFQRRKNSSFTTFARPHFVRVGQQAGMRFATLAQIASQLRIPAKTLGVMLYQLEGKIS